LNQVEESAKETVETRRQLQGEEHTQYAAALTSLANLYYSQGKYSLAEPLYRRALEINKKALGTSSADYANNLIYLARLLRYSGKPAQGEAMLLEASEIDRHALGEQHPQYTKSLIYLARTYQDMGQLDKAEPLYRKASEILRSSLGEDHPTYGESLGDLAKLCVDKGQYADAKKLSAQAEAILSKLGTQHPKYLNALLTHATTLARAGEYQQALAEISRVPAAMAYEDYVLYGVARVYGIAAQVVAAGNQLPQNERTRLADQFAAKSVQSLRDAAAAGFFENSGNRARLTTEFRSLNSRADFKQFLLDLDPAGKPK
jgi:tetratricopeptide (TPR) repeat protein